MECAGSTQIFSTWADTLFINTVYSIIYLHPYVFLGDGGAKEHIGSEEAMLQVFAADRWHVGREEGNYRCLVHSRQVHIGML